jgi:long-chain fatty acid transport protein
MDARRAGLIVASWMATSAVAVSAGSGVAQAAGFALREGSADWMANAFAGETAKAYDASTAFTNPAGMVRLNANEIDTSVNACFPRRASAARISWVRG